MSTNLGAMSNTAINSRIAPGELRTGLNQRDDRNDSKVILLCMGFPSSPQSSLAIFIGRIHRGPQDLTLSRSRISASSDSVGVGGVGGASFAEDFRTRL